MRRDPRNSHHLATISHDGRFWDAYLELEEPHGRNEPVRGRIAFSAAGEPEGGAVRTATIFLESTAQAVVDRARDFKTHQLLALLRSCTPDPEESQHATGAAPPPPSEPERPPSADPDQGEPAAGP